jgi:hypothetical protein
MERKWIYVLVGVGVAAAIVIGILGARGNSEENAVDDLCSSLSSLQSSTQNLTSLDPQSASKDDYESAVSEVEDDWDSVKSDAQDVKSASTGAIDSAWDSFEQTVENVPNDASVSDALQDIQAQGQALVSTTQSTISELSCS